MLDCLIFRDFLKQTYRAAKRYTLPSHRFAVRITLRFVTKHGIRALSARNMVPPRVRSRVAIPSLTREGQNTTVSSPTCAKEVGCKTVGGLSASYLHFVTEADRAHHVSQNDRSKCMHCKQRAFRNTVLNTLCSPVGSVTEASSFPGTPSAPFCRFP